MSGASISYQPSGGLCYDPSEPIYWDEDALQLEITRIFEICHGCRMCFKYCSSFPSLFDFIDGPANGDVRAVTAAQTEQVMDACFQCKLCEVQCPYTPRDSHEFLLDFPKLVHRYKAIRHKKQGSSLRERILGNPDLAGVLARASLGMANVLNRVRAHRVLFEKILGVHRDKLLPDFASSTFESWARRAGKLRSKPGAEVVLFQTCYVQHNEPQIGEHTVEVFEKNGVDIACVSGLKCCGMPAWEHGDLRTVRANASHNLDILMPHVEAGAKIVGINPTCSMMMRREYPELLEGEDRERAKKLAAAIRDPSEFLWAIRKEPRFNTDFKSSPKGKVSYHVPCHLRAQGVGFRARNLMKKIPGLQPEQVMECCAHDGTYAMTVEGFEPSKRYGRKAFEGMQKPDADIWATDCPLAALQFQQHAGVKPMHPMSVLAAAYREDGFSEPIEEES